MKKTTLILLVIIAISPLYNAIAQEEGPRFTTQSGVELHIPAGMDYVIDNPMGPNTVFNIYPPKNQDGGLAKANIIDGSEVTQLSAKKIVFQLASEEYLLQDQAKIVQRKDVLVGPVKIEFLSKENKLIAVGTENNQASFTYYQKNQPKPVELKAQELHFIFEERNGDRVLINIKGINNQSTRIPFGSNSGSSPNLNAN